jgi:hypothetical protein
MCVHQVNISVALWITSATDYDNECSTIEIFQQTPKACCSGVEKNLFKHAAQNRYTLNANVIKRPRSASQSWRLMLVVEFKNNLRKCLVCI